MLTTPTITFRVVEPTGVEKQAFQLFLEAYEKEMSDKHDEACELLTQLIADYPKSVYVERAYLRLRMYDELLEKCPDTGYLHGWILTSVDETSDEEEKQGFLERIIQEHPGTRNAKFAEQKLRRLQRGE